MLRTAGLIGANRPDAFAGGIGKGINVGSHRETRNRHHRLRITHFAHPAPAAWGFTPTYGPTTQSTLMAGEAFGWRFANGWEGLRYGWGLNQTTPNFFTNLGVGVRY
jgi:hypothetical protein